MQVKIKSEIGDVQWELPTWFSNVLKGDRAATKAMKVVGKDIIESVCSTALAILIIGNIIGEEKATKHFNKIQKTLYDISNNSTKDINRYLAKKK